MLPRISAVVALFRGCCPTHIIRRIGTIVVDTIQRHANRSRTDIFNKQMDVPPPFANSNAARSIVLERLAFRIETTIMNAVPNRVKRVSAHAVCRKERRRKFAGETSTGQRLARSQMHGRNNVFGTASAATAIEHALPLAMTQTAKDSPSPKNVARNYRLQSLAATRLRTTFTKFLAVNNSWRTATRALAKPSRITVRRFAPNNRQVSERLASEIDYLSASHSASIAQKHTGVATG